ncbi:MAG: GNAT family N-acetyltransferase [Promethearchaeota archaeon]
MEDKEDIPIMNFIKGDRINLIPFLQEDINLLVRWVNDPDVRIYTRNPLPRSIEEVKKWLEPKKQEVKTDVDFLIYHKKDEKKIGMVGLTDIQWLNRNANIFTVIGESEYWGKGIAVEAGKLMITYAFEELNLHKVHTSVYSPNERSLKAAAKIGLVEEAVLREEIYIDGVHVDNHKFAVFKKDWLNLKKDEDV